MDQCLLVNTEKERKMAKGNMNGLMEHNMKENGKIMKLQVMAIISGQMVVDIWVIGKEI